MNTEKMEENFLPKNSKIGCEKCGHTNHVKLVTVRIKKDGNMVKVQKHLCASCRRKMCR